MENVINAARSLGKIIQQDELYQRYNIAQAANEADTELQQLIEEFHSARLEMNNENAKADKDAAKVQELEANVKKLYAQIFANENMVMLSEARNDMEKMLSFVNQIITGASNGQDPDTIEYSDGCGGSCSSCSGCN